MVLVLTNDDGIDAPGIQALQEAVGGEGIVVAPMEALSGCSHQVTYDPIRFEQRAENIYALGGTPADCARLALTHLNIHEPVVLAGINAGGNLGADVYLSGTVAAVREAAFHGARGIAVSQYINWPRAIDWTLAARWTADVLEDLLGRAYEPGVFWNVNLPHLEPGSPDPEVVFCEVCTLPHPVQFKEDGDTVQYVGKYSDRSRCPDTDVGLCFEGAITISRMCI